MNEAEFTLAVKSGEYNTKQLRGKLGITLQLAHDPKRRLGISSSQEDVVRLHSMSHDNLNQVLSLGSGPWTLGPGPQTLNPKPWTLNPGH